MKTIIHTPHAPEPIGPYSQAVRTGDLLFVSGSIAIDSASGKLVVGDIRQETAQVMKNIGEVLRAAGLGYENIIKTSIFLVDMNQFPVVNEVYAGYFSGDYPARETVQVSRLPKDVQVEISVIASF